MNYGHLFGPFVIYKMWLLFKRANKIHVLLFIVHFHIPIFISFNHELHTNAAIPSNANFDPFETPKPIAHLARFF